MRQYLDLLQPVTLKDSTINAEHTIINTDKNIPAYILSENICPPNKNRLIITATEKIIAIT